MLDIDAKGIIFRGETDLEPASIAALENAIKLCRETLDARGIHYTVRRLTTHAVLDSSSSNSHKWQAPLTP